MARGVKHSSRRGTATIRGSIISATTDEGFTCKTTVERYFDDCRPQLREPLFLPDGTRIVTKTEGSLFLVHERPPSVVRFMVSPWAVPEFAPKKGDPHWIKIGKSRYLAFRVAMPRLVTIFHFRDHPLLYSVDKNIARFVLSVRIFALKHRIKSLDDYLYVPPLLNYEAESATMCLPVPQSRTVAEYVGNWNATLFASAFNVELGSAIYAKFPYGSIYRDFLAWESATANDPHSIEAHDLPCYGKRLRYFVPLRVAPKHASYVADKIAAMCAN